MLNDHSKKLRRYRAKKLLRLYGKNDFKRILFTVQKFNRQNDQIYAQSAIAAKTKATGSGEAAQRKGHLVFTFARIE